MPQENKKNIENLKIEKLEKSEVIIEGEITKDLFNQAYHKALDRLGKDLEVPGFRKGKAPQEVVVQHLGEQKILEEAARDCLSEEYPKLLIENKINAIGHPQITINKIARDNPLSFKVKTAVMPEVNLPDYKQIAGKKAPQEDKKEKQTVTEKEIDDVILQVRKNKTGSGQDPKKEPGGLEKELPELNDDFVKSLGNFKNVEDFKSKIRENLLKEKEAKVKEKIRMEIMEEIIKQSEISIPSIIIEGELEKMIAQLKYDVERAGMEFQDYLNQIKKTENDIKEEWREDAEKKAKFQLILNKIASQEGIVADKQEVENQVEKITKTNKEADPEKAKIYVESYITNEKVFNFLENQKE